MPSSVQGSDAIMLDAPGDGDDLAPSETQSPDDSHGDERRLKVLSGSTQTAASFEFAKEDHTLGNALRWVIMKNPAVEFCGYSIPHPSEERMNLRIQTFDGVSVYDVLEKGLDDLMDLCDVVTDKFTASISEWKQQNSRPKASEAQAADKMDEDD